MKKLIFSMLVIAAVAIVTGFSINNNSAVGQTEEYALIEVRLHPGKVKIPVSIATTIGEQPTIYDKAYRESREDFGSAHVLKKMHALNAQGFELLNSSISVVSDETHWESYYLYTFVKKVR